MTSTLDALEAARNQFPITKHRIYFDLANQNSPPECVTKTLSSYFAATQEYGGNKKAWIAEVESARRKAAALMGCDEGEIAFVKNTSEALNIAANVVDWRPGDNVVLPAHEHPNNVFPWLNLQRRGVEVRMVAEKDEWVDAALLAPFVDERTRVVSVADVAFHPGQRNDLESIGALCDKYGAHLVVDGVQAIGLLDVKPRKLGISMWAASGHKGLLSPHGIGLFYCRKEIIPGLFPAYAARASMLPLPDDHMVVETDVKLRDDARRFEIGNFNYSGICAMSSALDLILSIGIDKIERHVLALGQYLDGKLAERQIERLGPSDPKRRSSICAFNLRGDGWVEYFAQNGVVLSGRRNSVRISFGFYNTFEEIDRFIAVLDRRLGQ
jgi:cysteine desulfurase / selenocysteine lyase